MKRIAPLLLLAALPAWLLGQVVVNPWRDVPESQLRQSLDSPSLSDLPALRGLRLDTAQLLRMLAGAPREDRAGVRPLLALPLPDGRTATFEVVESPVVEAGLAARYPALRTFRGISRTEGVFSARFDWTARGFHAAILSREGACYIDPVSPFRSAHYIAYAGRAGGTAGVAFFCGAAERDREHPSPTPAETPVTLRDTDADPISLRTYRLAVACTGEYAQFHGGTRERALSAIITQVNRLNQVFERDLAIRVLLVARNDSIIYLNPDTDPYTNGNVGTMLDENVPVLNQRIGPANYDLGHVLGTNATLGGVALRGSVCSSVKGAGVSTVRRPEGDPFVISIIAHEIGHQFDARHSFNSCQNVDPVSAYEPGGGTTIMSYAGICGNPANDLQNTSDDYYHVVSLQEIFQHTRAGAGAGCATLVPTTNRPPVVRIPLRNGFFIPIGTPFELTAQGSDPDGDALTYCWEQFDLGPIDRIPGMPQGNSPLFRSLRPSESPTRVFPRLSTILNGGNDRSEVLPTYSRDLTFRCTVRDNNPEAGGVSWAQVAFRSDSTAGPFRITRPNQSNLRWKAGDYTEVRWAVANTTNPRVNCQYVNIRLSVDGGASFPYLLLAGTPNDGSAFVTVPDATTNQARLRVEAADNVFFDISDQNFEIWPPSAPTYMATLNPVSMMRHCLPDPLTFTIEVGSIMGYNQPLTFELMGDLPPEATHSFSINPVSPLTDKRTLLTIDLGAFVEDTFRLKVMIRTPEQDTAYRELLFSTLSNDFSTITPLAPASGERGIELAANFRWKGAADADSYDFELAESPAFGQSVIESATGLRDTSYLPINLFANNRLFFWRVRPVNECGPGPYLPTQVFQTVNNECAPYVSTNVPVNISGTGRPTIESTLVVDREGVISDVNVPLIRANYQPVKSLRITLISPKGTTAVLYDQNCGNTVNFRAGFDDQAPRAIACPPDDEIVFRPVEPLARFIGENTLGAWKLRVQVVTPGFGASGGLDAWQLEFCADITPTDPTLVANDTLLVPPGRANLITRDLLRATDDDAGPDGPIFLLVSVPAHGALHRNGVVLNPGDTFTQSDIDFYRLAYAHDGGDAPADAFAFLVLDGNGGFIPPQDFAIRVDENATVSAGEPARAIGLTLFPNPVRDEVNLRFETPPAGPLDVLIANVQGQVLSRQRFDHPAEQLTLPIAALAAGVYIVSIRTADGAASRMMVVGR